MSDVLAFVKDQSLLLTGLINSQVIRTAEMMDIAAVCFVRGKIPPDDVIELAKEKGRRCQRYRQGIDLRAFSDLVNDCALYNRRTRKARTEGVHQLEGAGCLVSAGHRGYAVFVFL